MSISSTSSTLITTNHNHQNRNHKSVNNVIMTHQDCEDDCISYDASSCCTGKMSQISGTTLTSTNTNITRRTTPVVDHNNNTESNDAENIPAISRPSSSSSTKSDKSQSSIQSKSLIRAMSSESLRRETKLKNMKKRKERREKKEEKEIQQQQSNSSTLERKNNHNNLMSPRRYNSISPQKQRGIMTVRTLQESLATADCHHSKTIVHNQRKRKRLQKRMDSIIRNVNVNSNTDTDTDTDTNAGTPPPNKTSTAGGGTSHDEELPSLISYLTSSSSTKSTRSTSSSANHSHQSNQSILSSDKFNVSFSSITIRDYPIIPGDNPTVSSGPPIAIDWNYITHVSTDINTFESIRHKKRRLQSEMKMPDSIRLSLLLNSGYKMNELRKFTRQAALIKKSRIQSIDNMHKDEWMEKMEERRNGIWNVMNAIRKHRKKEEEDRLLKQYEEYYHTTIANNNIDSNKDDEKDHKLDSPMTMQRSRNYNKAVTFFDEGKDDVNIIYDDNITMNNNDGDTTTTLFSTHIPTVATVATVGASTSTSTALKDNDNDNHGIDNKDDSHNDYEDEEEMIVSKLNSLYILPQQGKENGKVEGGVSFLSLFRYCMDTGDGTGTGTTM